MRLSTFHSHNIDIDIEFDQTIRQLLPLTSVETLYNNTYLIPSDQSNTIQPISGLYLQHYTTHSKVIALSDNPSVTASFDLSVEYVCNSTALILWMNDRLSRSWAGICFIK